MRVAIIDLGTNSVRLFVYELMNSGQFRELYHKKIMVRLGDNLFATGFLDQEAVQRTLIAFKELAASIAKFKVEQVQAVGTSAMREAKDSSDIIKSIFDQTGIKLSVISGDREAALIANGILANSKLPSGPVALVDIGGGSTEVTLTDNGEILSSVSLPIGAARGQQMFLKTVPPQVGGESALREKVNDLLIPRVGHRAELVIGSSGSIRAIGELYQRRKSRHTFPRSFLKQMIAELMPLKRDQIAKIKGIKEKRADLILSAIVVLDQVCECLGSRRVRPTNYALKDGILAALQKDFQGR